MELIIMHGVDYKLNNICWNSTTGTWWWSSLNNAANGNVCGNITITSNNQVFYRTCDNKLNNIWWNSSTGLWNWSGLNNSANNVAGDLMADNVGKVFYRSTSSNINCIYWTNGSWFWSGLDNSTSNNVYPGNIAIDNLGNVFFRGSDNIVHRIYYKSQCYYTPSTYFQKNGVLDLDYSESTYNDMFTGNSELGVSIYPNPTNNKINVISKEYIEGFYVYNIDGKQIKGSGNLSGNQVEIDVSMCSDGLYFIKVLLANDQFINSKFIVKH